MLLFFLTPYLTFMLKHHWLEGREPHMAGILVDHFYSYKSKLN
uniref:Uncharacterized protein n=1 Tax=Tetranychus urticae TaxID=32264 RepID=T1JQS5_TETUR